jgi:hypothetical protein
MTPSRYTLSPGLAPTVVAGLAVLLVGAVSWPYTVDDAFIVARYAHNLVGGFGYAMNPHAPSDGVTGPLWLLPQCLAIALGLDPIAAAKALGLAAAAIAAALVVRRLSARAQGRALGWIAAIACALSPSLGTWGASGLETGAATLAMTIAALAATARPRAQPRALGAAVALLAWLRPELALACGVLLGACWLRERRAGVVASAIALLGVLAVIGFRLALFGHGLPLSFAAKAGSLTDGAEYALRSLLLASSGVGVVLALRGALVGRSDDRVVGLTLAAHVLALVFAGGDWMPGYRLLVPVLPLYAWLLAIGVVRARSATRRRAWLAGIAFALALLVPTLDLATRVPELRSAAESQARSAALADWLHRNAHSIALVDVGYLGYRSGLPVLDLGGLTDTRIAAMPGGHLDKHLDPAYFSERAPDALVLHASRPPRVGEHGELLSLEGYPVERRVAALPEVRARYRVVHRHTHAPGYHYVVLIKTAPGSRERSEPRGGVGP